MFELFPWARPFFNVVVQVLHAEAGPLHPDHKSANEICSDLSLEDGLYVDKNTHQKLMDELSSIGYIATHSNEIDVVFVTAAGTPECGVMYTESEDEPDMFIWGFFDHNFPS